MLCVEFGINNKNSGGLAANICTSLFPRLSAYPLLFPEKITPPLQTKAPKLPHGRDVS